MNTSKLLAIFTLIAIALSAVLGYAYTSSGVSASTGVHYLKIGNTYIVSLVGEFQEENVVDDLDSANRLIDGNIVHLTPGQDTSYQGGPDWLELRNGVLYYHLANGTEFECGTSIVVDYPSDKVNRNAHEAFVTAGLLEE